MENLKGNLNFKNNQNILNGKLVGNFKKNKILNLQLNQNI